MVKKENVFNILIKIFYIVLIVVSLVIGTITLLPFIQLGNSKPILFLINQKGSNLIPNYAVIWRTQNPTIETMQWGNETYSQTISDSYKMRSHAFIMENLEPETQYWYKIKNENCTFITAKNNGDIHIALGGDSHFGTSNNDDVKKLLNYINESSYLYDGLFLLGDFVTNGFLDSMWKTGTNTISEYCDTIPFRPIIGNHDEILCGSKLYEDYFYPQNLPSESNSPLFYHLNFGSVHIICLQLENGIEVYTETEDTWLRNTLDNIPTEDWKIVISHSMPQEMFPIFNDKVDLVINGHYHLMETLNRSNVIYNSIGSFGNNRMDSVPTVSEDSIFSQVGMIGYIEISIISNVCNVTFHGSNNENLFSYLINKN